MKKLKYTIITSAGDLSEVIDEQYNARVFCGEYTTLYAKDGTSITGWVIKVELIPTTHTR